VQFVGVLECFEAGSNPVRARLVFRTQNFSGSAAINSSRSSRGHRTANDVWSSGTVTNIRPATSNVGCPHRCFSTVPGKDSAIRRTSSASSTLTL